MNTNDGNVEAPVCQLCGEEGADATGGVGDVVGVPVHMRCWMQIGGDSA